MLLPEAFASKNKIVFNSEGVLCILLFLRQVFFYMHIHWIYLIIAIVSEVIATSALKAAEGFTRWGPSLIVIVGYAVAFYLLSLTLRTIPLGIAYAIWSGVGIALVTLIGWIVYQQSLDIAGIIGIGLIVCGVIVLNLFSKAATH